jgi:c(7)-type cytochrome triheme protein
LKKPASTISFRILLSLIFIGLISLSGCEIEALNRALDDTYHPPGSLDEDGNPKTGQTDKTEYYNQFYDQITKRFTITQGAISNITLDSLPKGHGGEVNWTAAVLEGYISPRGSLDPDAEEMPPLDLNIFIEAKVPLMANVLFPHSIHTYWLSCNNCHPKIFIPQAGANPITMLEIFDGKWCGRCHGKVAFKFYPIANCRRCHILMKDQSLEKERFN